MVTPDGNVCDHCHKPLHGCPCYNGFFHCQFLYCSEECLKAAEEERLRRIRAEEYSLHKHGRRNWKVVDGNGDLVCVTLYKKGAKEVIRRLYGRRPPPYHPETGASAVPTKPKPVPRQPGDAINLYPLRRRAA